MQSCRDSYCGRGSSTIAVQGTSVLQFSSLFLLSLPSIEVVVTVLEEFNHSGTVGQESWNPVHQYSYQYFDQDEEKLCPFNRGSRLDPGVLTS